VSHRRAKKIRKYLREKGVAIAYDEGRKMYQAMKRSLRDNPISSVSLSQK